METRRNFLKAGCIAIAGATTVGSISLIKPKVTQASSAEHPYGWPIAGIDINQTKELGYLGYKGTSRFSSAAGKQCASGVFGAIIGQIQETVANDSENPYHQIPLGMMQWAASGVVGFGSLCGALNGACAVIGLVCNENDAKAYISDLLTWYSESALPIFTSSNSSNNHTKTIAGSNLCHTSVTNWCLASGYASGSNERSERCACLSADVAGKVVEMLNSGIGEILGNPRDNKTTCGACHYKGTDYEAGQFTRGKMNCNSCHVDIKKTSKKGHNSGQHNNHNRSRNGWKK